MPFTKDDPNINREGRPVGSKSFTTKVKEALEKIAEGKDYTYEEAFIKSILKKAIVDGDASTQRLIWNYLDVMPAQRLDLGNADDLPFNIKIVKDDGTDDKTIRPTV